MSGSFSYSITNSTVTMFVARIDNNDPLYDYSSVLALQLWATTNVYSGGSVTGYKVAEGIVGSLQGHANAQYVTRTSSLTVPPPGNYNVSLVLAEWNGYTFVPGAWANFTSQQLFGIYTPVITNASRAEAYWGIPFIFQIGAANNPTSFNATSLPEGLHVDGTTGTIYGIPTAVGTNRVTLSAGNQAGTGRASLTLAVHAVAPIITTQPTNQIRVVGQTATFSVGVFGTTPLTYHWLRNGTNLPGGTAATFNLAKVQLYDSAKYFVVVSNSEGWDVSAPASLSVFCSSIVPAAATFGPRGGVGQVVVTTHGDCPLTTTSNDGWLGITEVTNNVLRYTVAANPVGGPRVGTIAIADRAFTVSQSADTIRPVLGITSPSSGQRLTNGLERVEIEGTASDNLQVRNVRVRLNGADWADATSLDGWTNWTMQVTPAPGTNVISAFATDPGGRASATNHVSFFCVVPSTLILVTNGAGSIKPGFAGNVLELGRAYNAQAVPAGGQLFSNWFGNWNGGEFISTNSNLSFVMRSNLVLTVNFVPNPFLRAQGTYYGLFAETNRAPAHSGFFTLRLTTQGSFSANLQRGTNSFPFSGGFDVAGKASVVAVPSPSNAWVANLALNLDAADDRITGTIGNTHWQAALAAYRAGFSAATNPATKFAGRYTLVVPGNVDPAASPGGDSYGAVSVSSGGNVTFNGFLADGKTISQSVPLSASGDWALYAPCFAGAESVWGWLTLDTNQPATGVSGSVSWIRTPVPSAIFYPLGFTNLVGVTGARYTAPAGSTNRCVALTNGIVVFEDGNLAGPFTNAVTLTETNRVINGSSNYLTLSLSISNGLFSGRVKVPGTTLTNSFKGALRQDRDSGSGYFLGTNQSGRVYLGPE